MNKNFIPDATRIIMKCLINRNIPYNIKTSKSTESIYFSIRGIKQRVRLSDHRLDKEGFINIRNKKTLDIFLWHIQNNNIKNIQKTMS